MLKSDSEYVNAGCDFDASEHSVAVVFFSLFICSHFGLGLYQEVQMSPS